VTAVEPKPTPEAEARQLLAMFSGQEQLASCIQFLRHQFDVIQARMQILLTLATLALTITGFSGPKIAQTNMFARVTMAVGIVFVLTALLVLLKNGLRIRWISQFTETDPELILAGIIRYRDGKTVIYGRTLALLLVGLTSYVASVVTYLIYS
jgi:ABC-type uncharacterized transport system permease subunit